MRSMSKVCWKKWAWKGQIPALNKQVWITILLFSLLGVVSCTEVQQLFCGGLGFLNPVLNKTSFLLFPSYVLYLLVHFNKLFTLFYEGGRLTELRVGCVFTCFRRSNLWRKWLAWEPPPRDWHLKWQAVLSMKLLPKSISTMPPFLLWNTTLASGLQIYIARGPSMFWGYKQSEGLSGHWAPLSFLLSPKRSLQSWVHTFPPFN